MSVSAGIRMSRNHTKPSRAKLLALVTNWLELPQSKSNGGWAPVDKKDLEALYFILVGLIVRHWGMDADGDVPLEFAVIDRTKEYDPGFEPMPYPMRDGGGLFDDGPTNAKRLEQEERRFRVAMMNLSIATGQVNDVYRMMEHFKAEIKKAAEAKP